VRGQIGTMTRQENFGDNFWYMVYFQKPGVAEAELEADVRKSLRMIYYSISGDAPEGIWFIPKKSSAKFLEGLIDPPAQNWTSSKTPLDRVVNADDAVSGSSTMKGRCGIRWFVILP